MTKSIYKYLVFLVAIFFLSSGAKAQQLRSGSDNFSNSPTITVGGYMNASGAFKGQSAAYEKNRLPDEKLTGTVTDPTLPGTHNRTTNTADFTNDSEIYIKAGGINEYGMKYGAVVQLEADVNGDGLKQGINSSRAYIFTESMSGKFEFGNNIGANQKMKVGPDIFARAAGGINGKYLQFINLPMLADSSQPGVIPMGNCQGYQVDNFGVPVMQGSDCANVKLPRFILIPQSPVAHGGYAQGFYNRGNMPGSGGANSAYAGDPDYSNSAANGSNGFNKNKTNSSQFHDGSFGQLENATKLSYYTPRISGLQFGISATPDTGNRGSSASITGNNSGDIRNMVSWGINYSDNLGNLGVALSANGEHGKYEQSKTATIQRRDLNAYEVGAMATFFGFTVGASYGSWGKSMQAKTGVYSCDYDPTLTFAGQTCATGGKEFKDPSYWTGGLAYQFGPVAASITTIKSKFQNNDYQAASFGIDYRMAKGLMPYIELTQFKFTSNKPTYDDGAGKKIVSNAILDNKGYVVLAGLIFSF